MRYLFQMEFEVSDIEMGYIYDEGAVVTDPTAPAPIRDPLNVEYHQTTIPGARLPHVWLENADHEQISTHDLGGGLATFVLLVSDSEASAAWVEAAATAQRRTNVPVKVVRIGSTGDFTDPSDNWAELRGVNRDGAVLVRPDNHVAWRIADAPNEPADVLTEVLGHVVRAQLALA